MNADTQLRRAQVYYFLSGAFLYPHENWLEELPALEPILQDLDFQFLPDPPENIGLDMLQESYRCTIGLSGSLPYETEVGMPNEFSQSQELADIAGFYHAFGFQSGGSVRERPDYLATELEFLGLLALKQAYSAQEGSTEHEAICRQAAGNFLQDHLARWIGLFARALAISTGSDGAEQTAEQPYVFLARLAADFVALDADRHGVIVNPLPLGRVAPTPLAPDLSCEACPAAC